MCDLFSRWVYHSLQDFYHHLLRSPSPRRFICYDDRVLSTYETNKKKFESIESETKLETNLGMGNSLERLEHASELLTIWIPEIQREACDRNGQFVKSNVL
jgi:hypothetical protein